MAKQFVFKSARPIKEHELPRDWAEIIAASFSRLGDDYDESNKGIPHFQICSDRIDKVVADIIIQTGLANVLDVGVGDGQRLLRIKSLVERQKRFVSLYGTDISEVMVSVANSRGIETRQQDMMNCLPFNNGSMDAVLYLSGDFGYVMSPGAEGREGEGLRLQTLNYAHDVLTPGGVLVLEMMTHDNSNQEKKGHVSVYTRTRIVDGVAEQPMQFYLKNFRFGEVQRLVSASRFDVAQAEVHYMLRWPQRGESVTDDREIGSIVGSFPGFHGFDISRIHPNVDDIPNRAGYLMLVVLRK